MHRLLCSLALLWFLYQLRSLQASNSKLSDSQVLLEQQSHWIEVTGFLDSRGSVAVEELISGKKNDDETAADHHEASSQPGEDLEMFSGNLSSWLQSSPRCSQDFIPCLDEAPDSSCVLNRIQNPCLVSSPRGYMRPVAWPASIFQVRAENVGALELQSKSRAVIQVQHGNRIIFRDVESQKKAVDDLLQIPGLELGSRTRVVLNLEARVGSLSVELDKHGALTLSIASKNARDDCVKLVVERGYPGMIQSFSNNKQLPYPNEAFDLVHCGNCNTHWTRKGGLFLFEADRVLQRGGFFVWRNSRGNDKLWSDMLSLAVSLCWTLTLSKDGLAVWQKPVNDSCYKQQNHRPLCSARSSSDAWDSPPQPCISPPSAQTHLNFTWPARLMNLKNLLRGPMDTPEAFKADLNYWTMLTDFYLTSLGSSRIREIRNVLDANAGYGGFAAALSLRKPALSWWVLNVSPVGNNSQTRLETVFARGLLGVYHDWCTGFSMFPHAFDLVHASMLFSTKQRCGALVIMVEIDRLLRPGGFAIIRDDVGTLNEVRRIASLLQWKSTIQDTDSGPHGRDKVMHCQKTGR